MDYEEHVCPKTGFTIKKYKPGYAASYVQDGTGFMRELQDMQSELPGVPKHAGQSVERAGGRSGDRKASTIEVRET